MCLFFYFGLVDGVQIRLTRNFFFAGIASSTHQAQEISTVQDSGERMPCQVFGERKPEPGFEDIEIWVLFLLFVGFPLFA